ncbi:MAG: ParB N-terminal domain-containing protein [Burkholderiales bacterium]|nr:ParB N-terminal domain-containing protein [Anaerolineae bacterium]
MASDKRKQIANNNMFRSTSQTGSTSTLRAVDSTIYGAIANSEANYDSIEPISIFDIYPDQAQPRRTLPSALQVYWNGRPETVSELFTLWLDLVHNERGNDSFDINGYLNAHGDAETRPEKTGPIESAFLPIADLAVSIKIEGLTNPITVAHDRSQYRLETGERRWLAYHLLWTHFQDDRWSKIPARVVQNVSIWRQAAENNARQDLNAIGRARQFAILLMGLLGDQHQFAPYNHIVERGTCDRVYYAQVSDGSTHRIPHGKSEILLNATGLKHPDQLRQHRDMLRLPDEVWQIADDLNWSITQIQSLKRAAKTDEELVALALSAGDNERYSVIKITEVENDPTPPPADSPEYQGQRLLSDLDKLYLKRLMKLRSGVGASDPHTKYLLRKEISQIRRWLDSLEKAIEG